MNIFVSPEVLESFTWTTALYPASLVIANFAFVAMLVWRRRVKKVQLVEE